jgi:hypothetical protein
MADWLSLREHLHRTIAEQIDHAALHDPELRALLATHRERVLEQLVDKAELAVLRRIACDVEPELMPQLARVNGQHPRVVKVNGRA